MIDPYFTSGYKRPRVNHAHDAAWTAFSARTGKEQQADIERYMHVIHTGGRLTPEEYAMLKRFLTVQHCRQSQARYWKQHSNVTHYRHVFGGLNTVTR